MTAAARAKVAAKAPAPAATASPGTGSASGAAPATDPKAGGQPAARSSEPSPTPGATSPAKPDDLTTRLERLAADDKKLRDGEKALETQRGSLTKDRETFEAERRAWGEKKDRATRAAELVDKDKVGAIRALLGSDFEGDLLLELSKAINGESQGLSAADVDRRVEDRLKAEETRRAKEAEDRQKAESTAATERYETSLKTYLEQSAEVAKDPANADRWPLRKAAKAKIFTRQNIETKWWEMFNASNKQKSPDPQEVMDAIYADYYGHVPKEAPAAKPAPAATITQQFRQGAPPEEPTPNGQPPKRKTYAEITAEKRAIIAARSRAS